MKSDAAATPEEAASKDRFFAEIGITAETMIAAHGRDFAMGVLVLAARFIAENRPLVPTGESMAWPGATGQRRDNDTPEEVSHG